MNPDDPEQSALGRIVLDSGSEDSYIRQDFAERIGLEEQNSVRLNIHGMGGAKTAKTLAEVECLVINVNNPQLTRNVTLRTIDQICADLPPFAVKEPILNNSNITLTESLPRET